jgi:hypothetical protein
MSKLALSRGWSFEGRKRWVQLGWPAVAEPTACWKNASVLPSSGSGTVGTALKSETVTRNASPFGSGCRGRDHELLTVASPGGGGAVHRHPADAASGEVEVEARQRLRGRGQDAHRASIGCDGALVA